MAMRILRHEGLSHKEPEDLFGISVKVSEIGVILIYGTDPDEYGIGNYNGIDIRKELPTGWNAPYTGPRRLKLNKAWR